MINPFFFDEIIKVGFKIILESHKIIHSKSLLKINPNFPDTGTGTKYIKNILKERATFHARLLNQCKFKCYKIFSASFCKINEEDQRSDEIELFIKLKFNHNLTETDIKNNDVKSQLEHQIQIKGTKESGWIFDKNNPMKIRFYKIVELGGSSYVKFL